MQVGAFVAPPGYGASTAAMQLANHLDPDHCWLTIEPTDNDPARLLWHMAAALRFGDAATSALYKALNVDVRSAMDLMRTEVERLGGPTLLVLDGFHNLRQVELINALAEWVDLPPANLRLLCTSRREPKLPLDRVRARGQLLEFREQDLAFTRVEAAEVFRNIDRNARPDSVVVDELWERTAGWPAAFCLSALDMQREADGVSTSLGRYVDAEVLAHLPSRARRFLLETSILDALHPDLCNELTGDAGGLAMLEWLKRNSVLTTRTKSKEATFLYHPVLRRHLRRELAAIDSERYEDLANSAAGWYWHRGDLVSAISYATRARNVPLGKRLVADSWRSVADRAIFDSVRSWATAMGPDATADGIVCTILAWGALAHGDPTSMQSWIDRARTFTTETTAPTVIVSTELILAHWYCICGDLEQMRTHAQLANSATSEAEAEPSNLMPALKVAVTCIDGICALLSGEVELAGELLRAVNLPVREPHQEQALLDVLNYLSLAEVLLGNFDQALVHADEAILRRKRRPGISPSCSMAHLTRSIAYLANEDWQRSSEALQLSKEALDSQVGPVQRGLIHLQQARLHHFRGRLEEAHQALNTANEIERNISHSLLRTQVRSITNELRFISRGANDQLPPGARELTGRELEVIRELRRPESRREVARRLHISENTLKTHMRSISRKLDASGRQAIVERAATWGF